MVLRNDVLHLALRIVKNGRCAYLRLRDALIIDVCLYWVVVGCAVDFQVEAVELARWRLTQEVL